ncbi:hypothetical protein TrVE_jg2890 [Triparma verrucosa]|uniref:Cyclic nucleotide-binding domain-containing protein n=1 Tax=Triparma verrucosa TaxID=1606542 RepID=A0A9W7F3P7_9STRA|nr:hypothetical protein TrVE_jg2890 [Triparma verrucosa]
MANPFGDIQMRVPHAPEHHLSEQGGGRASRRGSISGEGRLSRRGSLSASAVPGEDNSSPKQQHGGGRRSSITLEPQSEHAKDLVAMLKDKSKLIEHFQKTHLLQETLDPNRDKHRRASVAPSSIAQAVKPVGHGAHDRQRSSGRSPSVKHRQISLKHPGEGMTAVRRATLNMAKLKKHVKTVGKAAIMLDMMKPTMITHKKGAKPANYDRCKEVLSKSPYLRNKRDCETLLTLVKNVKFFQNLGETEQLELCKVMGFMDVAWARQRIMTEGEKGSTFYVILVGSVFVQVKVAESKNLRTVAHLHPGDSFGEAALINNNPRNATVVSAEPSELLMIEKEDYERVIKSLHVDALKKKVAFINSIPAFANLPVDIMNDLASRVFFEKVPIHRKIWEQNSKVDPMKYLLIVKQGEVHVLKTFKVPKKGKTASTMALLHPSLKQNMQTTAMWNVRRADLCALGPSSAFLEDSMFTSFTKASPPPGEDVSDSEKTRKDAAARKKKAEEEERRGCTLVTSCCCEVGWLSKHIFNQLMKYGSKAAGKLNEKDQEEHESGEQMMTSLKEWMLVYPSEVELRRLYYDDKLWKEFKANVVDFVKSESKTKRAHKPPPKDEEADVIEKIRQAKYGNHPLACDITLPFRKPVDLLPMSDGCDISAPEFGLAPEEQLYGHVESHLTPRSCSATKKFTEGTNTFGYVSPVNSPRKDDGKVRSTMRTPSTLRKTSVMKKPRREITLRNPNRLTHHNDVMYATI